MLCRKYTESIGNRYEKYIYNVWIDMLKVENQITVIYNIRNKDVFILYIYMNISP